MNEIENGLICCLIKIKLANSIGEGEGIVLMDFFTVMGPWMAKHVEITAELAPGLLEQVKTYATARYNEFAANATAEQ